MIIAIHQVNMHMDGIAYIIAKLLLMCHCVHTDHTPEVIKTRLMITAQVSDGAEHHAYQDFWLSEPNPFIATTTMHSFQHE